MTHINEIHILMKYIYYIIDSILSLWSRLRHRSTSLPSPVGLGVGLLLVCLLLASCARMGRPDGGWYDETPPQVIGATPEDGGVNAKSKKISIYFDEFIKIENATEKVIVSPPQMEQAEIKAAGKKIEVELKDTLKENTTYTVDFSDAITDNNEGNPLGNYTYSFSTGEQIDTLEVSGCVVQASNLEPVKGILVGLYGEMDDSCFIKKPMLRVARADSRGHFVIRGVASGNYRIYALNDQDGNYRFSQKSEQIAFSRDTITPSFGDAYRQDTTWVDSLHIKDIKRVGYTRFMPDDIVLRAFNETLTDRYFLKADRSEANHFTLKFSYGDTELPRLRGLDFDSTEAFLVESNTRRDSIVYWLRDTALVNRDTLDVELSYTMTDSLGKLVSQTDTLQILSKQPYERRMKDAKKAADDWKKKQDKKKRRGEPYDSIMPLEFLEPAIKMESVIAPDEKVRFEFATPLAKADTSMIHLYFKQDTLWYKAPLRFEAYREKTYGDSTAYNEPSPRIYELRAAWKPDTEYSLEIDSLAFTDIYGKFSQNIKRGFKVGSPDDYSSLVFMMPSLKGKHIVAELLDSSDKPLKSASTDDGMPQFFYVKPGKYYARMFIDSNNNGMWDTGNYAEGRQPEELYYYPDEIECKAKWDVTLDWNHTARPVDRQKPAKITKQKAESQRKIQQRNMQRAKKLGIPYPF